MLGSLFIVISWTVWSVFLPLTLIGVNGYSASKASLALIALSVGSAVGANFFGNLINYLAPGSWITWITFAVKKLSSN